MFKFLYSVFKCQSQRVLVHDSWETFDKSLLYFIIVQCTRYHDESGCTHLPYSDKTPYSNSTILILLETV